MTLCLESGFPGLRVTGQMQPSKKAQLDASQHGLTFSAMGHSQKKSSGSREITKKPASLGLVIALATAGGVVIGSAGTYFFFKPLAAPNQSVSPATGATPLAQAIATPPQPQFTPAPQPPGDVPPGKVWSVEHGHWHDAPVALTTPTPATATPALVAATPTPEATPVPAPSPVTPAVTTPAPAAAPVEKKE
jgi:hypothetical protein